MGAEPSALPTVEKMTDHPGPSTPEPSATVEPVIAYPQTDPVPDEVPAADDGEAAVPVDDPQAETSPAPVEPTTPSSVPSPPVISPATPPPTAPGMATAPPATPPPGTATPPVAAPSDAGRVVGGTITAISAEEVDLTLDDGRPAVINRRNFDDQGSDPTAVYSVGDRAEGAVLAREDPKKRVVLSRSWALKRQAWEKMAALAESGETLTTTITGVSKRGVVVDVGLRGFVPASHLEIEPPTDLSGYVGQTVELKVLELDPAKDRLVLSRRSLLLREQRRAVHDLLTALTVGEIRTGTVASLVDYGAFVDLGGVTGLVHVSELSWERVRKPSDAVQVGQEVQVKILDVKIKKRRVSLSMRQLTDDPLRAIPVGEIVTGTVVRLVDFGAFVDIGSGEGLVHLSELAEHRVFTPEEIVTPGEEVRVKVVSVDKKRRRIELSIRQAATIDFG